MAGPDPTFDKATSNEVTNSKVKLDHPQGRESRSHKLEKTPNPAASGLLAGDIAALERKLGELAAANSARDPASSYMRSIEVQTALVHVGRAIKKPSPAMIDRLEAIRARATNLLAKAFHPTQAAVAEATSPRMDKPIWREEAAKWGAPQAIKIPSLAPAPAGPPGVLPDSKLIPRVPPHDKSFVEKGLDALRESAEPPKAPAGPEFPKAYEQPGVGHDLPGTEIIKSPPVPFDETAPIHLSSKPRSDAKHVSEPEPKPVGRVPRPVDKFQHREDLADHLNFIPHVALYNIYRALKEAYARHEAEEAKKPPEPPNPLVELLKKWFTTPHEPAPAAPPAPVAEERPAPAPAPEVEPGPHLEPIDPACATEYPDDEQARSQCELSSPLRLPNPEGGGSPRL
jgi:hypothetical protein